MPEGLSPEDNDEAYSLGMTHKGLSERIEQGHAFDAEIKGARQIHDDVLNLARNISEKADEFDIKKGWSAEAKQLDEAAKQLESTLDVIDTAVTTYSSILSAELRRRDPVSPSMQPEPTGVVEGARDANLWRAQQHEKEHLPEYIETAKQEAEAAGHEIKLKEPDQQ